MEVKTMKAVKIEYGAFRLVATKPNENEYEFNFFNGTLKVDDTDNNFTISDIINVEKFDIQTYKLKKRHLFKEDEYEKAETMSVLALSHWDGSLTFFCNSESIYLKLAEEFFEAFPMYEYIAVGTETITYRGMDGEDITVPAKTERINVARRGVTACNFLKDALANNGCKREFLKFLLKQGMKKSGYGMSDCVFDLPEDIMYGTVQVKNCFIMLQTSNKHEYITYDAVQVKNPFKLQTSNKQLAEDKLYQNLKKLIPQNLKAETVKKVQLQLSKYKFIPERVEEYQKAFLDEFWDWRTSKSIDYQLINKKSKEFHDTVEELTALRKRLNLKNYEYNIEEYHNFYYYGSILIDDFLGKNNTAKSDFVIKAKEYFYNSSSLDDIQAKEQEYAYIAKRNKGKLGEDKVEYALKWLKERDYPECIIVPKKRSNRFIQEVKTIELYNKDYIDEPQEYDHIVIGRQGIFVIETKNFSFTIIIDEGHNWISQKDGKKEGITNPTQQIDRHINLLKSIFNKDIPIIPIICIANDKAIIEGQKNSLVPLVKSDLLNSFIRNYPCKNQPLSSEEMKECLKLIEQYRY